MWIDRQTWLWQKVLFASMQTSLKCTTGQIKCEHHAHCLLWLPRTGHQKLKHFSWPSCSVYKEHNERNNQNFSWHTADFFTTTLLCAWQFLSKVIHKKKKKNLGVSQPLHSSDLSLSLSLVLFCFQTWELQKRGSPIWISTWSTWKNIRIS